MSFTQNKTHERQLYIFIHTDLYPTQMQNVLNYFSWEGSVAQAHKYD